MATTTTTPRRAGTKAPKTETPKPEKQETVQQLKNRLRNEAEREVLNNHKDEVIKITAAKYDEHGLDYVRRLSDEEKAAKAIEEYYRQFPNLRPVTTVQADAAPSGFTDPFEDAPDNYRDVEHREGE
jgi:hypothetical protein